MTTVQVEKGGWLQATPQAARRWESLSRRQVAEIVAPGMIIGIIGGLVAVVLAIAGGLSVVQSVVAGMALAIPLGIAGAGFEVLMAKGIIPLGPLTPCALYWFVAFPIARTIHAVILALYVGADVAVPHGWPAFLVYQVLVSVGFAIGFWYLRENFAPRWWIHLRNSNPVARHYLEQLFRNMPEPNTRAERRDDRVATRASRRAARRAP